MVYGGGLYGGGLYGGGLYGGAPRYPTPRVHVVFDRPAGRPGLITGVASSLEEIGGWEPDNTNSELSVNEITAWCHTGSRCLAVTAVTGGDIGARLPGVGAGGGITGGQTYLLWLHVRSTDQVRPARAAVRWTSATGVALATDTTPVHVESPIGHRRIGLLVTAPPGAAQADVHVTWTGCAAAETHLLDHVTMDLAGTDITADVLSADVTLSGRNAWLRRAENGSAKLLLVNSDGRYTPGRSATTTAPYAGNIRPRRKIRILAEYMGALYPVWAGETYRWRPTYPGGRARASMVTLDCLDGFRRLSTGRIPPPYRAEILADGPASYFPLDEPSGATWASDLVTGAPAALRTAPGGAGGSTFGATSVLPALTGGDTTDAGSTSLDLNGDDDLNNRGAALDLRYAGAIIPDHVTGWTWEAWVAPAQVELPTLLAQIVMRTLLPLGSDEYVTGFQLEITTNGVPKLSTGTFEEVATASTVITTGRAHHLAVTLSGGGEHGTAALWLDGTLVGQKVLAASPFNVGLPTIMLVGGALSDLASTPSFLFRGRIGHIALYRRALSADEIAAHAHAGADGHYRETEAERLHAILDLAGWPDDQRRIDRGLTQLLPRAWGRTNPLALGTDTVTTAGSVLLMDPAGDVWYPNRHRWINDPPVVADFRASFGTEAEASDFAPWHDEETVVNEVEVQQIGGSTILLRDDGSIADHGQVATADTIRLGAAADDETVIYGQWLLSRTASSHNRIDTLTIRPDTAGPALWPVVLPLAFGDRIRAGDLPDTAPDEEIDALVGQVSHRFGAGEWETTLRLEPAIIDACMIADHPVLGLLGMPAGY